MATVGFIGSGLIGSTLARLAVAGGYDVVLSNSRGPQTLGELVAELGSRASAATSAEAGAAGELVVVSIPFRAYRDVPVEPLAGKTIIDTNNYYPQRDGTFPELENGSTTASKLLQRHLPTSHVVRAFNHIWYGHLAELARPSGAPDRSALPIAGDDLGANAQVAAFLDRIGYDAVDVGALDDDWRFRTGTPLYGVPYGDGREDFWNSPARPLNGDRVRELLAAATDDPGSVGGRFAD
jgi:predicted dinucleotide-binding enzyme